MERTLFGMTKDWKDLKDYIIEVNKDLERQAIKAKELNDRQLQMRLTDRYSSYGNILEMMSAFDQKYSEQDEIDDLKKIIAALNSDKEIIITQKREALDEVDKLNNVIKFMANDVNSALIKLQDISNIIGDKPYSVHKIDHRTK